jgi:hypothetical protein
MNPPDPGVEPFDDELLRFIGLVTVEWGLLEQVLHRCIWAGVGLSDEAVEPRHILRSSDMAWQLLVRQVGRTFPALVGQARQGASRGYVIRCLSL